MLGVGRKSPILNLTRGIVPVLILIHKMCEHYKCEVT